MKIGYILSEYLTRYGIREVDFESTGSYYKKIEGLGHFSCEQTEDGVILSLMHDVPISEQKKFIKKALEENNPLVGVQEFSVRPVVYKERAGFVVPLEEEKISTANIEKAITTVYGMLQKMQ